MEGVNPASARSSFREDSFMGRCTWGGVTRVPTPRRRVNNPREASSCKARRAVGRATSRRLAIDTSSSIIAPAGSAPDRIAVSIGFAICWYRGTWESRSSVISGS